MSNSIDAIDRVLEAFGFEGELKVKTPRAARRILLYRNELREFDLGELREADRPFSGCEQASRVYQCEGKDAQERRLVQMLHAASDARYERCDLRNLAAASVTKAARRFGSDLKECPYGLRPMS